MTGGGNSYDINEIRKIPEAEWDAMWISAAEGASSYRLPPFPPESLARKLGGTAISHSMKGALRFRRLVLRHAQIPLDPAFLDFGCGWGRHIRVFLKDFDPRRMWGVDIDAENIATLRATLPFANFTQNKESEPLIFRSGMFDLSMSLSVFSHLNEDSFRFWFEELLRVSRPGGTIAFTTWGRYLIDIGRRFVATDERDADWEAQIPIAFPDIDVTAEQYGRGEFVFGRHGHSGSLANDVFGLAMVPRAYIEKHYPNLQILMHVDDADKWPQALFICRVGGDRKPVSYSGSQPQNHDAASAFENPGTSQNSPQPFGSDCDRDFANAAGIALGQETLTEQIQRRIKNVFSRKLIPSTAEHLQGSKRYYLDIQVGEYTYGKPEIFSGNKDFKRKLHIGRYCSFGPNVQIMVGRWGRHPLDTLSTYPFTVLYPFVLNYRAGTSRGFQEVLAFDHERASPDNEDNLECLDVIIGNDVWVGMRSLILAGVHIADGAVIGAGSVVTRNVEPYAIVAGVPAKVTGYRFEPAVRARLLQSRWWEHSAEQIWARLGHLIGSSNIDAVLDELEREESNTSG